MRYTVSAWLFLFLIPNVIYATHAGPIPDTKEKRPEEAAAAKSTLSVNDVLTRLSAMEGGLEWRREQLRLIQELTANGGFTPSIINELLAELRKAMPPAPEGEYRRSEQAIRILTQMPADKLTPTVVNAILDAGSDAVDPQVRIHAVGAVLLAAPYGPLDYNPKSVKFRAALSDWLMDPHEEVKKSAIYIREHTLPADLY